MFPLVSLLVLAVSCQKERVVIRPDGSFLMGNDTIIAKNTLITNLLINTTTFDGSYDNVLDRANCIAVLLPVTVTVYEQEIKVKSESDYQQVIDRLNEFNGDDEVVFIYPIKIQTTDYSQIIIENVEDLDIYRSQCLGENVPDPDIECIDFKYPLIINTFDLNSQVANSVTVVNDEAFYEFLDLIDDDLTSNILFPATVQLFDDTIIEVNSSGNLVDLITDNTSICDEDDDFDFNDNTLVCGTETITQYLQECRWNITDYNGSGSLSNFNFEFGPTTLNITDAVGNLITKGSWGTLIQGNLLSVLLDVNFEDVGGNWIVEVCSSEKIVITEGTNSITFTRACCDNPQLMINDLIVYMPFGKQVKELISGYIYTGDQQFTFDRADNEMCAFSSSENDTVQIPVTATSSLTTGDSFTVSFWFQMQNAEAGDLEVLFRYGAANDENGFTMAVFDLNTPLIFDNSNTFSIWDNDWNMETDVQWMNKDWHHLAVTCDGTMVQLYRDGLLRGTGDAPPSILPDSQNDTYEIGDAFDGNFDDLRVYNRVLNSDEIEALFSNLEPDCYQCL